MILGNILLNNAKMAQKHFMNGPNRTKYDNKKNAEIHVNIVKVVKVAIQNGKYRPFIKTLA